MSTLDKNLPPPETASIDESLLRQAFAAMRKTFRGTIWENAKRFRLVGKAYEAMPPEQDGFFDIRSARHLEGPLRALQDPLVRVVIIIGATQVMKSVAGDIWIPYILEHELRNVLVLFESDPKALLYCDTRFMDTIKQHPELKKYLAEVDRHDVTKTEIKMAGAKMVVGGLNDSNVSSLSWPIIWISEGWQAKSNGMLRKAIKRADRFPDDCKILIESQAGLAGEDLYREAVAAHPCHLTWACPYCGGRQTWETPNEFGRLRPENFIARKPLVQRGGIETPGADSVVAAPEVSQPELLWPEPKPGTFSGMKFDGPEKKLASGETVSLSISERARSAYWECYWCGAPIRDSKAIRQQIMDSYEQDYQITLENGVKTSPRAVCFYLPKESARNNPFEASAATYLAAKEAQRLGNDVPMQDWYLQERAMFYDPGMTKSIVPIISGSYSVEGAIPDEICRVMGVDAQQDDALTAITGKPTTGHFWYVVRAIDKFGNLFQLDRGYATSWDELIAVQDRNKVTNENVGIDVSFFRHDIIDMAAQKIRPYTRPVKKHGRWREATVWHTWTLLQGTDRDHWRWPDGKFRSVSPQQPELRRVTLNGQSVEIKVPVYMWSNLALKDQLASLISGGEGRVKFLSLSRSQLSEATQRKEAGDLTYENQMSAEYKTTKRGKAYWEKHRANNHYWDCESECLALFQLAGHMGVAAAPDQVANEVG